MIVLGVNAYPASGESGARQERALAASTELRGVVLLNLQWRESPCAVPGWRTVPLLRDDSVRLTGRAGPRKPVAREVFDLLCAEALRRRAPWFAYTNSDVRPTQGLIDHVGGSEREAFAVSRTEPAGVTTAGVDTFLVRAQWWQRHRRRFRRYILGEPAWDNVYAAILMRHADAELLNSAGWSRHEAHPVHWGTSPYAEYTRWLCALDRRDFSRWAEYHWELVPMRAAGASHAEEAALAERVFRAPQRGAVVQWLRAARAGLRYLARA